MTTAVGFSIQAATSSSSPSIYRFPSFTFILKKITWEVLPAEQLVYILYVKWLKIAAECNSHHKWKKIQITVAAYAES